MTDDQQYKVDIECFWDNCRTMQILESRHHDTPTIKSLLANNVLYGINKLSHLFCFFSDFGCFLWVRSLGSALGLLQRLLLFPFLPPLPDDPVYRLQHPQLAAHLRHHTVAAVVLFVCV